MLQWIEFNSDVLLPENKQTKPTKQKKQNKQTNTGPLSLLSLEHFTQAHIAVTQNYCVFNNAVFDVLTL